MKLQGRHVLGQLAPVGAPIAYGAPTHVCSLATAEVWAMLDSPTLQNIYRHHAYSSILFNLGGLQALAAVKAQLMRARKKLKLEIISLISVCNTGGNTARCMKTKTTICSHPPKHLTDCESCCHKTAYKLKNHTVHSHLVFFLGQERSHWVRISQSFKQCSYLTANARKLFQLTILHGCLGGRCLVVETASILDSIVNLCQH